LTLIRPTSLQLKPDQKKKIEDGCKKSADPKKCAEAKIKAAELDGLKSQAKKRIGEMTDSPSVSVGVWAGVAVVVVLLIGIVLDCMLCSSGKGKGGSSGGSRRGSRSSKSRSGRSGLKSRKSQKSSRLSK